MTIICSAVASASTVTLQRLTDGSRGAAATAPASSAIGTPPVSGRGAFGDGAAPNPASACAKTTAWGRLSARKRIQPAVTTAST